ncbi:MAG: sugar ABC transporter permease [Bacteroidota bacterium]
MREFLLSERRIGYLFVVPALLIIALVALYPAVNVLWLSLHRKMLLFNISQFVGLDNYLFLLRDSRFWNSLWNTAYFTGVSVALELALGLGFALVLHRSFRGRGLMRAIVLVPWAIPTVVSAKMWDWMYNSEFGVINYVLKSLGLVVDNVNWLGNPFWAIHAAIAVDVWKTTPFVALLLLAGLQVIPHEVYEAGKIDGVNRWQAFRRITLPLLKPVILIVLLFRTLDAFRVFDVVYVLTSGGPADTSETLSIYAYKLFFTTLQFGYGSTIAVVVFLCVLALSFLYIRFLKREVGSIV